MSLMGLSIRGKEFRTAVKGAVAKGFSSRKIEGILRATYGKSYQRTILLKDMRIFGKAKATFEPMKFIRKDRKAAYRHYQFSSKTHERKFATVFDYTYKLRGEKEVRQSYYTVRHGSHLDEGYIVPTIGELEDVVKAGIEREYEVVDVDVIAPREAYELSKPKGG